MKKVGRGLQEGQEINRVLSDPRLITVPEMEAVLKKPGTYLGTTK